MNVLPIIFFHYGNPTYLKYSLKQAKYFNPNSSIYLLGDKRNNKYPFVTHVLASKYEAEANAFTKVYKHLSTNSYNYELNCFLRWFHIKAFCRENNIEAFIYLDSDVLVFQDFSTIVPGFKGYEIANTCDWIGMPAFTWFNNFNAIDNFCNYLIHSYTARSAIEKIEQWYKPYIDDAALMGGVSDMLLFHFYFLDNPDKTLKVDLINNELAIDVSVNNDDGGYEMQHGMKKIYWQNNLPYCKNLTTGKLVRFATLHYQGTSKKLITRHYKGRGYAIQRFWDPLEGKAKFKALKKYFINR